MARRGKYGQLPAAAPSLTSTILSIAHEMETERETNLMDAWQKGGEFEGKPVTDEMVLAFWKGRLKDVDKNDPLYDTYSNTISQTEYSVAESKMSTWYARIAAPTGADDRRMAAFYTTWSAKIPKDSEFYRVLQRDGAQFIRSAIAKEKAAAGGSGGGGGGPTKAQIAAKTYADAQTATYMAHEQQGDFLTQTFTNIAKGNALIGMESTQGLTDFDPNDPAKVLQVINNINTHPDQVVYYTAGGPVTGAAILTTLKKLDPTFTGKLTVDYYGKALASQLTGQNTRLDLATSTGHKADITATKKSIAATTELGRESNAWPIEQSYQQLRTNWLKVWQDPNATPDQKVAAWSTYQSGIVGLATSKTHPPDQNTYTRLIAEAKGDGSVDSLAESFTGNGADNHASLTGGSQGDIADTHASLTSLLGQQQAVATGGAVWAMGTTGSDGIFHPGAGSEIGAATPSDVQAASPAGAIQVWVTQTGAQPIAVWVAGKTVTAKVVDSDGNPMGSTTPNDQQVATAYDVSVDGKTTRLYGYQAPGGQKMYTTDAPWGPNVQAHDTGSGVQLTVTLSAVPTADTVGSDPNFLVTRDATGKVTNITVDPGRLVLTETDPVRYMAGPDPHVDSLSPSVAMRLDTSADQAELADLSHNQGFAATVDQDLRIGAGGQYNPQTGQVEGGDPAIYNEGAQQVGFSYRMNDPRAIGMGPKGGEVFFGRSNTSGTVNYPTSTPAAALVQGSGAGAGPDVRGSYAEATGSLPSDAARGTAFSGLAGIFQPGTNRIQPASEPSDQMVLAIPHTLKVPGVATSPKPYATPSRAPAALPAPTPTPTAVPAPPVPVAPPGPTDSITSLPVPVTPTAVSAGQGAGESGFNTQATTTLPKATLPKPLPIRSGQRPI